MNFEWVVVNVALGDAQEQLNALDKERFDIYATHTFTEGDVIALCIIARRQKKPTGDIRY